MPDVLHHVKKLATKYTFVRRTVSKFRNRKRKSFDSCIELLRGRVGLEIGGPTKIFSATGPFPVYPVAERLDNVNFSENNFWSDIKAGDNYLYSADKNAGKQIISDAVSIPALADASYDLLLSSHVIEHIANPICALVEWKRLLRPGGTLVIVAPDKRYTYDRMRKVTSLEHIIEDYKIGTTENDKTHLAEIIEKHDLTVDSTVKSFDEHKARTLNNPVTRISHHHVFDIGLLRDVVEQAGFKIVLTDVFRPYHLLVVAQA